jgi:Dolichyl-phosphate-mannose-protein mannosyltransferase
MTSVSRCERSMPAIHGRPKSRFTAGPAIVLYLAAVMVLFHLLTARRYGIFRDELYFLDCAEHLDWGYVDQPPLIALIAWFASHVLGGSLVALRLLPALAGAALVWLTGKIAREMGGGRFAQTLAALAVIVVPIYMILQHWLTMNAFEPLVWMGCAWCVVRMINTGDPRYWLGFGVLAGVGMENKYSVTFFVAGVLAGLLLTPERRFLGSRWLGLGALAGLLIFLPNLVWLVRHDFPFLQMIHNARTYGGTMWLADPLGFIRDQAMILNPVLPLLWVGGLLWLLFDRDGSRYRALAWTYVVMLGMFIVLTGKNYYLTPVYPMLFAAGAVAFEKLTRERWTWTRGPYVALALLSGVVLAPSYAPVLPVQTYVRLTHRGRGAGRGRESSEGLLPQYFADEFGWEDMTREIARAYNSLPPAERAVTAIFANNYGEAGAIDYFGPKYGLPKAISTHQNYWYWGPRNYSGASMIVLGSDFDEAAFKSVRIIGHVDNPYSMPAEHFDLFLCQGLKWPLRDVWPRMKHWS